MKIAVSAQGKTLEALIDPRFGRCAYFFIIDVETDDFQVIENDANSYPSGAGIKSAGLVVDQGVSAVLTGRVGPKAAQVLETASIKIYDNVTGTVLEALQQFKN
ncbi:MAG: NifB/NifX family molybdenum-iron cluster-binding protein [Desulfobacterales bacterium]|nr:NifB/NifX family molybdenum-iron cluster-binding protein [Desulfobacterales bacterium]